jgi:regulator of protease activity HflC (stomatin/prohibitin superfamily)
MRKNASFAASIFIAILVVGVAIAFATSGGNPGNRVSLLIGVLAFVVATVVALAVKVANEWDRVMVLRLGKFRALKGPGLFFIISVVDAIAYWIDTRVITMSFKAEKTLTKDTVPVDVDVVLFWKVIDPKKAALNVADYQSAIGWPSQTALRDVIGKTMLSDPIVVYDKPRNSERSVLSAY